MTSRTTDKDSVKVTVTVKDADELKAAFISLFRQVMDDEMLVIPLEEAKHGEEEKGYINDHGFRAAVTQ